MEMGMVNLNTCHKDGEFRAKHKASRKHRLGDLNNNNSLRKKNRYGCILNHIKVYRRSYPPC